MIFNHVSDDYNRVVLEPDGDGYDEGDYINASYVDVSATDAMQIHNTKKRSSSTRILRLFPTESDATEGLHSDAGPDGNVDRRLLAHGVAGAGLVHRHGHKVRLHSATYNTEP